TKRQRIYVIGDVVGLKVSHVYRTNTPSTILPCKIIEKNSQNNETLYVVATQNGIIKERFDQMAFLDLTAANFASLRALDTDQLPTITFIQASQLYTNFKPVEICKCAEFLFSSSLGTMDISLIELDGNDESTDNQTFRSSMEYILPDGVVVDLLQKSGVKEHANRYATSLMDTLFKPDELLTIETKNVSTDERYILLKEAVRNKFRLTQEELESMWICLHTVILTKRRTISAKRKKLKQ
ncbi:unnamed protein product, partial [Rotaria magnacalcarata]